MSGKPVVVIFTGTSNTGGAALDVLKEKFADQLEIRAVVRVDQNVDLLKDYSPPCKIIKGDVLRPVMLGPVLHGCKAAYFAVPSLQNRAELGRRFVDVCIEHGVEYGILGSIVGADKQETEYQRQFYELEQYVLSKAGTPVKVAVGDKGKIQFKPVILRCAPFYQNFYGSYMGMKAGSLYYPLGHGTEKGRLAHVDFHDVGKVIACILANPEPHANKVYNLIGEYHAGNQIAGAITMKAGVGVKYHDVDDDTTVAAFEALGLQPWIAAGNVETIRWFREGNGQDIPSDILAITGDHPTKFGDFVRVYLKPLLTSE